MIDVIDEKPAYLVKAESAKKKQTKNTSLKVCLDRYHVHAERP